MANNAPDCSAADPAIEIFGIAGLFEMCHSMIEIFAGGGGGGGWFLSFSGTELPLSGILEGIREVDGYLKRRLFALLWTRTRMFLQPNRDCLFFFANVFLSIPRFDRVSILWRGRVMVINSGGS